MRLLAYGGLANWPWGDLLPHSYDCMMIDPAWQQRFYSAAGEKKAPQAHYKTTPFEEIATLPVLDLAAPNCLIWVWAINPMLDKAIEAVKRWGFEFKTAGSWEKMTVNNKQTFSTGYILRGSNEPYIIATRGKPKTSAKNIRSSFHAVRGRHSEKPDKAYENMERMMPNARRLEIFSRTNRPGWDAFGDEAGKFDEKGEIL